MEKAEKRMPVGKLNGIGPDGRMCTAEWPVYSAGQQPFTGLPRRCLCLTGRMEYDKIQ